jgi:hypothetical protein
VELGAPNCVWKAGTVALALPAQSHPVIVGKPIVNGFFKKTCDGYVAPKDEITRAPSAALWNSAWDGENFSSI